MPFRFSAIAMIVFMSACSDAPRDAATPAATPAAAVAAAKSSPAVMFSSNPATIRRCESTDGNATVSLSWDVRPASVSFVSIRVGDKVLAEGRETGSAATGNWVRDDTLFTLVDAGSLEALATLQIPFVDC